MQTANHKVFGGAAVPLNFDLGYHLAVQVVEGSEHHIVAVVLQRSTGQWRKAACRHLPVTHTGAGVGLV